MLNATFSNLNENLQNYYPESVFVSFPFCFSAIFLAFSLHCFFPHFIKFLNIKSMMSEVKRIYFQQVVLRSGHLKKATCCINIKSKVRRISIALNFCPLIMFI